ncbi:hypothetical protein TanjilG_29295 [Lupinus angustifolius]|uniref:Kinesin-like protein n=1 Tax=Lupinus angustifolius TaxID=3871 RepID=A0A1J7I4I1_LUPAN|nr:hypothetical protein TanjilG_29295 [Lupinus angustifolius]
MSNITVCVRFRPLTSKEKPHGDDSVCIRCIDSETFIFKDEKDEESMFSFDRVFYEKSEQADVYQFLALPIVRDAANAINGTIITYGQTGAGKTYSMEGPGILECDEQKKGLLPRVVKELFDSINLSEEEMTYSIKLSMVEIYMEKVRDLFDLSKDNLQINESKSRGIFLPGVTEITVRDPAEAFQSLYSGIANRAVGQTQSVNRTRSGKLILVDLAGSEKVEKTGAEGRVLEEAKAINKSLSALGNVVNSLTCSMQGKAGHIPYRDSKLTRILQDALGGNARTALLCCCSPSAFNASESLSTFRFGARQVIHESMAKHIKASPHVCYCEDKSDTVSIKASAHVSFCEEKYDTASIKDSPHISSCGEKSDIVSNPSPPGDGSCARILNKLGERLNVEDVKLLEKLFILEGILFDPLSVEEESEIEDLTLQTISSLQEALENLTSTVNELKRENNILKAKVDASTKSLFCKIAEKSLILQDMISVEQSSAQVLPSKSLLSSIENTKSWFQFYGDGFAIRVPPEFQDITEPEDYNAGLSLYGDKAKPKTFAARFASVDGSEVLNVVTRTTNQLKITFLEAQDITALGSLKDAAKIFIPGGATIYSARSIKVKEEDGFRTYYFYEFGRGEQHIAMVVGVSRGKAIIAGATAPQSKWDSVGVKLRSAAVSLSIL